MKDIPVFTTENGAASLMLSQIPFTGNAYILLQASRSPENLLEECAEFCRCCGAERIFAAGDECLSRYPCHGKTLRMQRQRDEHAPENVMLWPLLPENSEAWRKIYNSAMKQVDYASCLSYYDMKQQTADGDCYFIHENGNLLGIGKASDGEIRAIVSVVPGSGGKILRALMSLLNSDTVKLTVASTNERAIRLYRREGFLITGTERSWYEIS